MKKFVKNTPIYPVFLRWNRRKQILNQVEGKEWMHNGRPVPPPHIVKQVNIKYYAKIFNIQTFVETGTFYGDMVHAVSNEFKSIYSIELSEELFKKAKERFKGKDHIHIIQGDSGVVLPNILKEINKPTLFWLDGHYSEGNTAQGEKDTPIYQELNHIFEAQDLPHVILIDDARDFTGENDYPTIPELKSFILSKKPNVNIIVEDDSIQIIPQKYN